MRICGVARHQAERLKWQGADESADTPSRRLGRWVLCALAALALFAPQLAQAIPAAVVAPKGPLAEGHWPQWDNAVAYGAPEQTAISDCTFAAVADWEILKGYPGPMQQQLVREFIAAGGNERGLYTWQWRRYLLHHGINGVRMKLVQVRNSQMDEEIAAHGAVLAVIGDHALVVAGYNSTGPEVITYGETRTETWAEWDSETLEVFVPVVVR
ncbi:MAG: hypothetical protein ACYDHT_12335 [Solirubrobacteraceae bacterium]